MMSACCLATSSFPAILLPSRLQHGPLKLSVLIWHVFVDSYSVEYNLGGFAIYYPDHESNSHISVALALWTTTAHETYLETQLPDI